MERAAADARVKGEGRRSVLLQTFVGTKKGKERAVGLERCAARGPVWARARRLGWGV